MGKKPKKARVKAVKTPSAPKTAVGKESIGMSNGTTGQQPPQTPPQEETQTPVEPKAKGQSAKPLGKGSPLDEWAKEAQKWETVVEEKDLRELAARIVPHIDVSPQGVIIAETQKIFLGSLLLGTIFQIDTGMLEDFRMIAPNYRATHPKYDIMRKNWELLKAILPLVHPSVKGVMDWKVINRKLKTFARIEAIKMLAADKAKDLTEPMLLELQKERHDLNVIKYCVDQIATKGIKDGRTVAELRKETSTRLKREKRLQRAEKTNDMVEALTKSLGYKIRQPPIMFSDIGKLNDEERKALKEKLLILAGELAESLQYIKELVNYLNVNGTGRRHAQDFVSQFIGESLTPGVSKSAQQE
jgi:hypothetical protein